MAQRTISSIRDIPDSFTGGTLCVGGRGRAAGGVRRRARGAARRRYYADVTDRRTPRTHVLRPAHGLKSGYEDSVHCVQIQILIPPLPPWVKPRPLRYRRPGPRVGQARCGRGQNPRSVRVRSRGRGVRHPARHGGMMACTHDGAWTSLASWTEHTHRSGGPVWRMSGVRIQ